jgi:hypothetical protein
MDVRDGYEKSARKKTGGNRSFHASLMIYNKDTIYLNKVYHPRLKKSRKTQ